MGVVNGPALQHDLDFPQPYLLYIDLNVLLKVVSIEIQHQVMHKIESVTDNDQGKLISQLSFLKER